MECNLEREFFILFFAFTSQLEKNMVHITECRSQALRSKDLVARAATRRMSFYRGKTFGLVSGTTENGEGK